MISGTGNRESLTAETRKYAERIWQRMTNDQ